MPAAPREILVAAIGNAWLKDQGFGLRVVEHLRERGVPACVELASWEHGMIAAFQRLSERIWRRAIFVSATARGRPQGMLHCGRTRVELPGVEEIHGRIGDSVMGLVAVDNLLIIGRYYERLPEEVLLVEAEPADETWGSNLSPTVAQLIEPAAEAVLAGIEGLL